MEDIRYPAQLPHYRPIRRRPGRPLKRLLDGYNRVRPKQVICWRNFVPRRRKRRPHFIQMYAE